MRHLHNVTAGLRRQGGPKALGFGFLASCLILFGCARLPDVDHLKTPPNAPAAPSVVDNKGALSSKDASSVLPARHGSKVDAKTLAGPVSFLLVLCGFRAFPSGPIQGRGLKSHS